MPVTACDVPEDSPLARFGGPQDYRDCFMREIAGEVTLADYIEAFYCSAAFRPERIVLRLIGSDASSSDARALARGKTDRFGVWEVVERTNTQILLHSKGTGTASWLAVSSSSEAVGQTKNPTTKLMFGSWVGDVERTIWRSTLHAHVLYSRVLLESAARGLA